MDWERRIKANIKARKKIYIDTNTKIHTPKTIKKEKYKWDWRKEIDLDDLRQLGIDYE